VGFCFASCYATPVDDQIIARRIAGKSVHAIAKTAHVSVAEVNRVIDAWAESTILALELARFDELQQIFCRRAIDDGVQSGLLVTKLTTDDGIDSRPSAQSVAPCGLAGGLAPWPPQALIVLQT
jgi:hypothetical protein